MLYAENELFGAELNAVRSQADAYTQVVNVYKAVGGWVNEAEQLAPKPQGVAAREAPAAADRTRRALLPRRSTHLAAGPPQHRGLRSCAAHASSAAVALNRPALSHRAPPARARSRDLCQRNT